jgi:hypothetical protein
MYLPSGCSPGQPGLRPTHIISSCRQVLKGFNFPQRALRFRSALGCTKIVYRLQIQPELCGAANVAREAHGGIGSDTPALKNDVTNARRTQVQGLGKRV